MLTGKRRAPNSSGLAQLQIPTDPLPGTLVTPTPRVKGEGINRLRSGHQRSDSVLSDVSGDALMFDLDAKYGAAVGHIVTGDIFGQVTCNDLPTASSPCMPWCCTHETCTSVHTSHLGGSLLIDLAGGSLNLRSNHAPVFTIASLVIVNPMNMPQACS